MPTQKKWQVLEGVVTAIERSLNTISGASVVPNAAVPVRGSNKTRQVDVLVVIPTGSRTMRIGVEVKDECAPLDVTKVEQLAAKFAKLELDRGCVVAKSGFTAEAHEEAVRCGVELRTIAEVGVLDWWLPTSIPLVWRRVELIAWGHVPHRCG
jgi:hypothetical protein